MHQWLQGDRSHPHLVELDSLVLSYPGYERDVQTVETSFIHNEHCTPFEIQRVKLKQCIHNGDRNHPQLVELDSLALTYPGWENDVALAENTSTGEKSFLYLTFESQLEGMKNKQRLFNNDRSHPHLVELDSLDLSYPGHERDVQMVETSFVNSGHCTPFEIQRIELKQCIHDDNRAHPHLVELDSLDLTYPGWENDIALAENTITDESGLFYCIFESKLEGMKNKQRLFINDRSHPQLVELDSLALSYPEYEKDVKTAEKSFADSDGCTSFEIQRIKLKQCIYDGNRAQPQLVELDSLALTYPGWENDVALAEETLTNENGLDYYSFDSKLKGMKNKQKFFLGYRHKDCGHCSLWTQKTNISETTKSPFDLGICIICMEEKKSHVFVPCGHVCVCDACSLRTIQRNDGCPVCRGNVTHSMRLYFS